MGSTHLEQTPKAVFSTAWFQELIEECKVSIVETSFQARWIIIEGWHKTGEAIIEREARFEEAGIGRLEALELVSSVLGCSPRSIAYAVQFAKAYPDLKKLPADKGVSWTMICHRILDHKNPKLLETSDAPNIVCPSCGFIFKKSLTSSRNK